MDRDRNNSDLQANWTEIVLPIFAGTVILLVLFVFCQFFWKPIQKCCCPNSWNNRSRVDGRRSTAFEGPNEDLPPNYSVLSQTRSSADIFQVAIPEGDFIRAERRLSTVSTICEKLPSYEEFVKEGGNFENGHQPSGEVILTDLETFQETQLNTPTTNENIEMTEFDVESIITATPPPYRPKTAK